MPTKIPASKVTIVGGGVAGLTAALRLAERGFAVEIFEKGPLMGGNLSGVNRAGVYYDVYPHMFSGWFHNFWKLAEDIGLTKERDFERRTQSGFLRAGHFPHYHVCADIGAFHTGLKNLSSGVLSLPEMFLTDYTILDALASGGIDEDFLTNQTLNDFIVNRPYATPAVTKFFDSVVNNIWSINSYLSSALAYERFAKYQFREPSPQCWVMKGNSYEHFVKPLLNKLNLQENLHNNVEIVGVSVTDGRATTISYKNKDGGSVELPVENLILAASPASLGEIIFTTTSRRAGAHSVVSLLPDLANVRHLGSDPLPVLYVAFKRKLAHIPPYYVALLDSKYSLTFVQVEELSGPHKTVLAVAASDFDALPIRLRDALVSSVGPLGFMQVLSKEDAKELKDATLPILKEFKRYVPFDLKNDVDWDNTFFQPNLDQQIFINQVGSQQWLTKVNYPEIDNLYFAGNTCANPITIATVESAVYSGLQAARAVVERHRGAAHFHPVPIIDPKAYPASLLVAWKIMLSPYAALAKLWVEADALRKDAKGAGSRTGVHAGAHAASEFGRSAEAAVTEWWKMTESLCRKFMR